MVELKELKPGVVEVGDLYLIPPAIAIDFYMLPARVVNVDEEGFDFECGSESGNDLFAVSCRGVLVKEKDGKVEIFVDKNTVDLSK